MVSRAYLLLILVLSASPALAREFGGYDCTDDCSGHQRGTAGRKPIESPMDRLALSAVARFRSTRDVSCTLTIPIVGLMKMMMAKRSTIETAPLVGPRPRYVCKLVGSTNADLPLLTSGAAGASTPNP
jgi:hypothetical protein